MAKKKRSNSVIARVQTEQMQGHPTRAHLFTALEEQLGMPVVTYFTSFRFPVMIEDDDADMLESVLQEMDLSKGLALCISSPGGDGLAAERIVNVCRSYSKTGEYIAVVPGKAKSAATMVCFGASKILMGPTSELGPIDPQLAIRDGERAKRFSVFNIVRSYDDLFQRAVESDGNLAPFLQQLERYDEREIKEFRSALELSDDIAVRALASGMMKGKSEDAIRESISTFLSPQRTKVHGRAIYRDEALKCGLTIEAHNPDGALWPLLYELYIRTETYVATRMMKSIESRSHSLGAPVDMADLLGG